MTDRRIITVGASLGGVTALQQLVRRLPAGLPAPVIVVQHIGAYPSRLPELLSASGPLTSSHAADGDALRPGHLHIAPPDHHVLVEGGALRLTRGPKEHHTRPAVDPLFRSAALSHGAGVVGVVLTGGLDDGTAGLQAIKEAGGIAVVQDPAEAEEPSMPLSALRYVSVDHCLGVDEIGALLGTITCGPLPGGGERELPDHWRHEHAIALHQGDAMEHLEAVATPSTFVCPDCKGSLWKISGANPARFLCHTGHCYTLRSLRQAQAIATDEALWTAIRALQEKRILLQKTVEQLEAEGDQALAQQIRNEMQSLAQQEGILRTLVEKSP